MSFHVEWTRNASKELLRIPKKQRIFIATWVQSNLEGCDDPRHTANGKQLKGTDAGWRWRIGSYRILGRIEDERLTIVVVRVGHRQGVYSNLPDM